jgi:hypothetical protein
MSTEIKEEMAALEQEKIQAQGKEKVYDEKILSAQVERTRVQTQIEEIQHRQTVSERSFLEHGHCAPEAGHRPQANGTPEVHIIELGQR